MIISQRMNIMKITIHGQRPIYTQTIKEQIMVNYLSYTEEHNYGTVYRKI